MLETHSIPFPFFHLGGGRGEGGNGVEILFRVERSEKSSLVFISGGGVKSSLGLCVWGCIMIYLNCKVMCIMMSICMMCVYVRACIPVILEKEEKWYHFFSYLAYALHRCYYLLLSKPVGD